MRQRRQGALLILGVGGLLVFGLATGTPVLADDSSKSTGTGTVQGEKGKTSTQRGGNTGPTTGRNSESGSATGKVRDPHQSEPDQGSGEGTQRKSTSSHAEKHPKYDEKETPHSR
jgi:hypothetical protein